MNDTVFLCIDLMHGGVCSQINDWLLNFLPWLLWHHTCCYEVNFSIKHTGLKPLAKRPLPAHKPPKCGLGLDVCVMYLTPRLLTVSDNSRGNNALSLI